MSRSPCAACGPIACTSVMKIASAAIFNFFVNPNSCACLIELLGVAAAIGERYHVGAGRLRLQQERREVRRVGRMPHRARNLAALGLHDARDVRFHRVAEGIVGGQEEPGFLPPSSTIARPVEAAAA